ncbi:hypothetical protein J2X48_002909 [Bosea sp. BE271]|jgi:hypothetical protein|uniref:DUF6634 family protein n=1 Tax=Bosea TaxID=85413 RepID=UPI0028542E4E|nr:MULTISPECIES: DUF6634 family protein [Bosea]MDR6828993.1 hypothetical protein [Bosea robiniae]MDR6895877.1 hypothetical protein [Bosea sp. BE109]MDR7139274.1 hypothetical protein [Bosea sp. BE168]MDR7175973.1 hypothetical protein [Bosea sp. BE271]
MDFTDPRMRSQALKRIDLLRRLTDDLTGIVNGSCPSPEQLEAAVGIRAFSVVDRSVPCLQGLVTAHPTIRPGPITTSQLFYVDVKGGWARSLSRFYRLEGLTP